ncbi:sugar phosphate isomerase [Spirochaetia bacterium]|nr:sugar phosphate isomerase [Spirochaetia bacterium]
MGKIALNISSVRKHQPGEVFSIVEKLARIGYDGVEFISYTNVPAKELRKVLDANGIVSSGNHITYESLTGDLDAVLDYNMEIGSPCIVCPRLPEQMRNIDGAKQAAEALRGAAERCKKQGIRLMYQHHDWELVAHNGKNALDIMAEILPEELFFFQMETYWLKAGGHDAPSLIDKYRNRCVSIHIGDKKNEQDSDYTELGKGVVDLNPIIKKCKEICMEWYNIQQEHYTDDMFASIKRNYEYLKNLTK